MTTALLRNSLVYQAEHHSNANAGIHVDDSTFQAISRSPNKVLRDIVPAAVAFCDDVKNSLNLTMSDKSKITSNDCKLAESIQSHLSKAGHSFQIATTVKHLGIQYNSAKKRPVSILSSRIKKTRKRFLKTKLIASVSRKPKWLYAGSCLPSATWGHQSAGISPT